MKISKSLAIIISVVFAINILCSTGNTVLSIEPKQPITILAGSDFQNVRGNISGKAAVKKITKAMTDDGITSADGFLFCGDYDYDTINDVNQTQAGIIALKESVSDLVATNMVLSQGNHDSALGTVNLTSSGKNDDPQGRYGVFVINEDDYMWSNNSEKTIKHTAQNLIDYLNEKIAIAFAKPIFVISHLPLNYNLRTYFDGDGMYASYIFNALNEAGEKGLNLIFLFGHDHSNGWDDYLGGSSIFLKKGDNILIAKNSKTEFETKKLNFTYMNAGYVGYYSNVNNSDSSLTMSAFKIYPDKVVIARYDCFGKHNLKSAGVTNAYKNETQYPADTSVYISPQTISLTKVTTNEQIKNIISHSIYGRAYKRITSTNELEENEKYILVCNSSDQYIMIPKVVTKTNSSGISRIGFDIELTEAFGDDTVFGSFNDKEWTLKKSGINWLVGLNNKYITFTRTSGTGIKASLETNGNPLMISGTTNNFTFMSPDSIVLNYNVRGLINGYASSPAPFDIYKYIGNSIKINGGAALTDGNISNVAKSGDIVTLKADVIAGKQFDKWIINSESAEILLTDAELSETTFIMPDNSVSVTATYVITPTTNDFDFTLPSNLIFDGNSKKATVTAKSGIDGLGIITVKYFNDKNEELSCEPINAGTYIVKVDITKGTSYNAVSNLEIGVFTITDSQKNVSITTSNSENLALISGYDNLVKTGDSTQTNLIFILVLTSFGSLIILSKVLKCEKI